MLFKSHNSNTKITVTKIHEDFLTSFGIDLDQIKEEYSKSIAEDTSKNNANRLKVQVLNNKQSNHDSASDLVEWKNTFYLFFVEYEKLLYQLNTKNQNDLIQDECTKIFGLDIQEDLLNCAIKDEVDPISTLENIYGINIALDIHDTIIKQIEILETRFKNRFHHNLRKSYIDCLTQYEEYKEKKKIPTSDMGCISQQNQLRCDHILISFEQCWNIISSTNIGEITTYNTLFKYVNMCISGKRMDVLYPTINSTTGFNNDRLIEMIIDQYHLDVKKRGIAVHIYEQLDYLTSSWNNYLKIAVLLDLYWEIQESSDKMNQVKVVRLAKDKEVDFNNKIHVSISEKRIFKFPLTGKSTVFTPAFFQNTYTVFHKGDIKESVNYSINSFKEKNLLYPFLPKIQYNKTTSQATVPDAFSEFTLNISLNKKIHEFYKNNFDQIKQGNNDKYKTFEDLLSIYSEQFTYTKIEDYYFLENFTCLNLSMKLYEYLWPIASELINDNTDIGVKKHSILYKYLNEIVSALFRIKSPYLRLRVTDIVIQSYGGSKYLNKTQYITALISMNKFLNQNINRINNTYSITYNAIYYYYLKEAKNESDHSHLLNELDALVNTSYSDYIRLDPDCIHSDIESKSNSIWRDLLNEKKGTKRTFYHNIIKAIMLNRTQN